MAKAGDRPGEKSGPGSRSASCGLRYTIYCPACGALNFLDSSKDYYRGRCAECGSPFRFPAKLPPKTWRMVACVVSAAVLSAACIWMLFFFGGEYFRAQYAQRFPVPPAPAAGEVKKLPLPSPAVPPEKPLEPAHPGLPKTAPTKAAPVVPPEAPAGGASAPGGGAPAKALIQKPGAAGATGSNQTGGKTDKSNGKPISPALREKPTGKREKTGGLLEIPLPK